jgi:hypothetical protein
LDVFLFDAEQNVSNQAKNGHDQKQGDARCDRKNHSLAVLSWRGIIGGKADRDRRALIFSMRGLCVLCGEVDSALGVFGLLG